ncbi:hypothetical protein AXF13_07870 [Desulfovibrio fairfieldensis]|uniref:Uncharacterized protein n=1 Tax=Desulfovibrio fairfieldensis TaxID=44742 RepID=A0A0X8JJW2_9BACT|nr:hypothetical protein AXF13_07870 [Desulfovibrio fairfieldensis]
MYIEVEARGESGQQPCQGFHPLFFGCRFGLTRRRASCGFLSDIFQGLLEGFTRSFIFQSSLTRNFGTQRFDFNTMTCIAYDRKHFIPCIKLIFCAHVTTYTEDILNVLLFGKKRMIRYADA